MNNYKIGFFLSDTIWEGGFNYITNMCKSINIVDNHNLEFYYFVSHNFPNEKKDLLLSIKNSNLIVSKKVNLIFDYKFLLFSLLGYNYYAHYFVKLYKIDLIYEFSPFLGTNIPFKVLTWIPDLQHKELPNNFSTFYRIRRELQYKLFAKFRQLIHFNSNHTKKLFNHHYKPHSCTISLPFSVLHLKHKKTVLLQNSYLKYNLPKNYFYVPNQFWKHKNHIVVLKAVLDLKNKGINIFIVMTGSKNDLNNSSFYDSIVDFINRNRLDKNIFLLGKIPYLDTISILIHSCALINPSLYEGWSTTVEEAKCYNLPAILSDIPVHREQASKNSLYFNPNDYKTLAMLLLKKIDFTPTSFNYKSRFNNVHSDISSKCYAYNLISLFNKFSK